MWSVDRPLVKTLTASVLLIYVFVVVVFFAGISFVPDSSGFVYYTASALESGTDCDFNNFG